MSGSLMDWAKESKNKKFVFLMMLLIILAIFLTFYPFKGGGNESTGPVITMQNDTNKQMKSNEEDNYEERLERKLEVILSQMEGVGAVDVMVTTISTEEKIIAHDINTSQQKTEDKTQTGTTRITNQSQNNTNVVLQDGNVPYVTRENAPEIRGVFILAQGAEDSNVKMAISEAVSKLLDVPIHKISIEKKKN